MKRVTLIIFVFVAGTILCLETIKKSQANQYSEMPVLTNQADSTIAQSISVQPLEDINPN